MTIKYYESKPAHAGYQQREQYKDGSWAMVTSPTSADLDDLAEQFNLTRSQLTHVRDHEELPRLEFHDDVLYLFIRHAYTSAHGERETAPLLLIGKSETLLVIDPHPLAQEFNPERASRTLRGTTLQVIEHVLDQYGVYLDEITHRIKSLRRSLHKHEISNQDLAYFVTLEEELNDFVTSLEPMNAILQRLVLAHHFPLTAHESEVLGDLSLKNQQLLNATTTLLSSIESIRNAHGTIATNNLNRTMKILTVATVLLTLPNVVFGSLGMNMRMPEFFQQLWAYPLIILVTFFISFLVYIIARKKKIF